MAKKRIGTWNGVPVYTDFLPIGTRRTGQKLDSGEPKFGVVHDTGNPNTTAQQNVNYYKNTYNIDWDHVASAHIFIDDKECIICVPITEKAWHVLYNTTTDNYYFGDDANDIAFGAEISYFTDKAKSMKSLDNACRILAALYNSWELNPRTMMPGHQDIQSDKQDPGNLLAACGYGRNDMKVIDDLVVKYMDGDSPVKKVAKEPEEVVKKSPKKTSSVLRWSDEPHYKGTIKYNASLRSRSGSSKENYSFGNEVGIVNKGATVYIYEEMKDGQGNVWCRTYSGDNNGWVHKDTIKIVKRLSEAAKTVTKEKTAAPAKKKATTVKVPDTYTVVKGDTLTSIAKKYNTKVGTLVLINGLTTDKIFIGQELKLKGKEVNIAKKLKAPKKGVTVSEVMRYVENLAKTRTSVDMDHYFNAQCLDLIIAVTFKFFKWWPSGDAKDLATQSIPTGWKRIQNTSTFVPKRGDILIWIGTEYGHTAIATGKGDMTWFQSVDQNWNANGTGLAPAQYVNHDYTNFWGVIRPPYTA